MVQRGYIIYTVRQTERGQPDQIVRFDGLPGGGDMHTALLEAAQLLRDERLPVKDEKHSKAFKVTSAESMNGRGIWIVGENGRYGSAGNNTNVDNGARRPFGERDANMTEKRAMLWLPKQTQVGLLFVERVGGSHLHDPILKYLLQASAHREDVTLTTQGFADAEAWTRYIDEAEGFQVNSVWAPKTVEQKVEGGRLKDAGKLRMELSGVAAEAIARRVGGFIKRRFQREEGGAGEQFSVPREITPRDPDDYIRQRVEVKLTDGDGKTKTLVVEREDPPTFIYDLGDTVDSAALRRTWEAEIDRLSRIYGDTVVPS